MRPTVGLRLLLGLAVAATLAALACGGDTPTGPAPVTRYTLQVRVVTGTSQQPVANATVKVLDGANLGRTAVTDATGTATLADLEVSGFTIEVSAENYVKTTTAVTLTGSQSLTVSLTLNTAPVISWITAGGNRPGEPGGFADLNEEISVSAGVSDLETPVSQLTLQWTADGGTFIGSGPSVTWRAPATGPTPKDYTLTLTVIEKTSAAREMAARRGGEVALLDNTATAFTRVRVHDSTKEIGDLTTLFLTEFSNSAIPAATVVRNFADKCNSSSPWNGKQNELQDITNNRTDYVINSYRLGSPVVAIGFGGWCAYGPHPGDACVAMACEWRSTKKLDGSPEHVVGTCQLTTVYEAQQWKLCWSSFEGKLLPNSRFIR